MLSASKHQWLTLTSAPTSKRYWPPRVGQVLYQMYVRLASNVPLDIAVCTRWFKYDWDWLRLVYTKISPGHIWITLYFGSLWMQSSKSGVEMKIWEQCHDLQAQDLVTCRRSEGSLNRGFIPVSIHSDCIKLLKHNLKTIHCCHACNYQHTGNISCRSCRYVMICVLAKWRMHSCNGSVVIVIKPRTRFGFHTTVMFLFHILRNNYMNESFNFLKDNYRSVLFTKRC
jgi:hypothetical protein